MSNAICKERGSGNQSTVGGHVDYHRFFASKLATALVMRREGERAYRSGSCLCDISGTTPANFDWIVRPSSLIAGNYDASYREHVLAEPPSGR
jgi:hypothetical protein